MVLSKKYVVRVGAKSTAEVVDVSSFAELTCNNKLEVKQLLSKVTGGYPASGVSAAVLSIKVYERTMSLNLSTGAVTKTDTQVTEDF